MIFSRRGWIQAASAALIAQRARADQQALRVAGREVEIQVSRVSAHTVRITVLPIKDGGLGSIPMDGSLVQAAWEVPVAKLRRAEQHESIRSGDLRIRFSPTPPIIVVKTANGETIQQLKLDPETGIVSFSTGTAPLLGLGEGGPQFDRRGSTDRMRSGQGGYKLRTHGGRVPIPWIIGTGGGKEGWALVI